MLGSVRSCGFMWCTCDVVCVSFACVCGWFDVLHLKLNWQLNAWWTLARNPHPHPHTKAKSKEGHHRSTGRKGGSLQKTMKSEHREKQNCYHLFFENQLNFNFKEGRIHVSCDLYSTLHIAPRSIHPMPINVCWLTINIKFINQSHHCTSSPSTINHSQSYSVNCVVKLSITVLSPEHQILNFE